jgi:hypothetical protein
MTGMRPRVPIAALTAALLLDGGRLAAQCALCSESISSGSKPGGGDPAVAFSVGVLILLGVLAFLAAGFVAMVFYAARGADRRHVDA